MHVTAQVSADHEFVDGGLGWEHGWMVHLQGVWLCGAQYSSPFMLVIRVLGVSIAILPTSQRLQFTAKKIRIRGLGQVVAGSQAAKQTPAMSATCYLLRTPY